MKAFPNGITTNKDGLFVGGQQGMDLRDYFAAMALLGLIAGGEAVNEYSTARVAYGFANAMMEVRNETNE